MDSLNFRTFRSSDLEMLTKWLEKGYIKNFWGDPQEWIAEIKENFLYCDWIHYYIVEYGQPIGFVQYYETSKAPFGTMKASQIENVGIDYMIGEESFLNKGFGNLIIMKLIEQIKALGKYKYIIADPNQKNIQSIKVLIKNGFEPIQNGLYALKI